MQRLLSSSSLRHATVGTSHLRRLQSTTSSPQAAPPSAFQRVKGIVWSTEGIVVASVFAGMYFAYFVSGWQPSGRQMPNSAHYEYKVEEATVSEEKIRKDSEDVSSFKAKTDAVFKDFKP